MSMQLRRKLIMSLRKTRHVVISFQTSALVISQLKIAKAVASLKHDVVLKKLNHVLNVDFFIR